MPLAYPVVPEISITLASPEEVTPEPFSPFATKTTFNSVPHEEDEGLRATLLSPPPILSPRKLSPLRPAEALVKGQGLERERFERLLQQSKERNVALGCKKEVDLRKEIAMKAHRGKQAERRALFLSKIKAPPSPAATLTPKTPPESPAIFHYSLPSPGLESPGELLDSLALKERSGKNERNLRIEQVDFRSPGHPVSKLLRSAPLPSLQAKKKAPLPSLDEITTRLASQRVSATPAAPVQSARLPAFLQRHAEAPGARSRTFPGDVGRLRFPVRKPSHEDLPKIVIDDSDSEEECATMPSSPALHASPRLEVFTTVVPPMTASAHTPFSRSNLQAWEETDRAHTARTMLTRLRRRTMQPVPAQRPRSPLSETPEDEERKSLRRRSAPPELPARERGGFYHPVLDLPGAF